MRRLREVSVIEEEITVVFGLALPFSPASSGSYGGMFLAEALIRQDNLIVNALAGTV